MAMKTTNVKKRNVTRGKKAVLMPLTRENYIIFGIGLVVLVFGFIFLAQGPWDSFWSRTLAPIVLVIGYCVIIPAAILYSKKRKDKTD